MGHSLAPASLPFRQGFVCDGWPRSCFNKEHGMMYEMCLKTQKHGMIGKGKVLSGKYILECGEGYPQSPTSYLI